MFPLFEKSYINLSSDFCRLTSVIYYYHYNGVGSVTTLTDSTSSVVGTYEYDSYGNTLSSTGSVPNPYGFSTKEFSSQSGLIYFGARYYNPTTGRWLKPDPLGMVNGPNLYAYCNNNPTNLIDPWGLQAGMGAVGGAIAGATAAATKCPKGNQTPTNPDESWWDKLGIWWGIVRDIHRGIHQSIRNQASNMPPYLAGWTGAELVTGGGGVIMAGGAIAEASIATAPAGLVGLPVGLLFIGFGVEAAWVGFDFIIGASG